MEAAVVSVAHGAMGSLLGKLGELLTAKYKLLTEAEEQIRFLKSELESMYVFQKKISDAEEPDEQDKCWAKEVRELSYDIEDSVNEFIHRVEGEANKSNPQGFKGFIERIGNLWTAISARHEIAREFQGLKRRAMELNQRRTRYKVDGDAVSRPNNTTIDRHLLAIYAETSGLVGIEGPRDELIEVMDGEGVPAHQLKVLSIMGFGGLGKTTLANEIYRKMEGKFQCRAFVSVSQKPNITKILRTILSQVGFVAPPDTNMELWGDTELISALRNFLSENRYLIVIDDIWKDDEWNVISCALPENFNGSRVITTTRIETVARASSTKHIDECVYKMKALTDQDSRSLFFKRIFGSEDACPPCLKEVSAEILKKCGGLPLAIITTSSLLASQPNKLFKERWEYVRDSLGSNCELIPSLEGMRQILNLSYINLPHCLKTCMLYLGIYPEDYTIHKNDLARQWVAEGFISKSHGTNLENTAKIYFNELINRSMIQPIDTDYNGEVMSCRVHDMMLELILQKSREENFITVIDVMQDMEEHPDKIRRLSFNLDGVKDDKVMRSIERLSQTRTLARFGNSSELPPFIQFKHLRVLIIEISNETWPFPLLDFSGICHLFQLRCLKIIAKKYHVVLPSKIGNLQQLETFEIKVDVDEESSNEGKKFLELPPDIVHLSRLLHLIVPSKTILPHGIGNMKSLHTLRGFNLVNSQENIKSLGELTNLTHLKMSLYRGCYEKRAAICGEVLRTCLEKLCNLKCLTLSALYPPDNNGMCMDALSPVPASLHHLQRFHLSYNSWFSRIPQWIGQYHSLYGLYLIVKEVLEDDVGVLAQLPCLIHLGLYVRGTPRDKIIISGSGFPVLKHFDVSCCRISLLTFQAGAMANVERLSLAFNAVGWDRHSAAPDGIEHLSGLKELKANIGVWGASESNTRAAESVLRSAAEMHPRHPTANIHVSGARWVFDDREPDEI